MCRTLENSTIGPIIEIVDEVVYDDIVLNSIVPANFWLDPYERDGFKNSISILAEANNYN